jgi:hypothetical protein
MKIANSQEVSATQPRKAFIKVLVGLAEKKQNPENDNDVRFA